MAVLPFVLDFVCIQPDVAHFLGAAENARQQLAQRHNHIHRVDRRAHDFSQQRAENQMIFVVEKHHLEFLMGKFSAEDLGAFYPSEASAYDNDASFSRLRHKVRMDAPAPFIK